MCSLCHGVDGKTIDLGGGEGVGDVAVNNPWEGLHEIRWGHPGTAMPSAVVNGFTNQQQTDILTHAQTLPTVP
ncbi:MAG: c-type cytochrome [Planctomycetota bacterium]|jgi:mono/diheme cytochrome c family protein